MIQVLFRLCFSLLILASCKHISIKESPVLSGNPEKTKNIILFIVDGMGQAYVDAARIYNGNKKLSFERFPCHSKVSTCAKDGVDPEGRCLKDSKKITDSAAGATAMATGTKVLNGMIARSASGKKHNLKTILEMAKDNSKSTGIIATKLFTDATPAAFASHAEDRKNTSQILKTMFEEVRPNLIMGADTELHREAAKKSGVTYQFIHSKSRLNDLVKFCSEHTCPYIYGGFSHKNVIPKASPEGDGFLLEVNSGELSSSNDVPHLSEMTKSALKILSKNQRGFFLMVESSMPDMIGHYNRHFDHGTDTSNSIKALVFEMLEVDRTAQVLAEFVKKDPDTLIILTSDHETGGLILEKSSTPCLDQPQCMIKGRWTSETLEIHRNHNFIKVSEHTGENVPLYASGKGSELFCRQSMDNTDINLFMRQAFGF